jgi:1-acyl-sn-glycerol-3-phosphate acyltransferase
VFYWVLKAILTPLLRPLFRPWAEGVENVPDEGAVILASNHLSWMDWIFMPLVLKRRVYFLAKSDYFTERGLKGGLKKAFFAGTGQVPIDRSGGAASEAALSTGKRILAESKLLGIYPEGTRSPDGKLYRGKTGPARMALEAGLPVIPVAMIGLFEVAPPGAKLPRIRRVGVRFGEPLDFSRYAGMQQDRFVLRSMTDEIMYEIMLLSGQEYVDVYATKAKEQIEAARRAADEALVSGDRRPPAGRPAVVDVRDTADRAGERKAS